MHVQSASLRADGKFTLQFATQLGRAYVIEYSSDLINWQPAQPAVSGNGATLIWVDSGPPQTTAPQNPGARFYRVIQLPQ
jgi:hypothetical protein